MVYRYRYWQVDTIYLTGEMYMKSMFATMMTLLSCFPAYAHSGHDHEAGWLASLIHLLATNHLWLSLCGLVGVVVGYRIAIKKMGCTECEAEREQTLQAESQR